MSSMRLITMGPVRKRNAMNKLASMTLGGVAAVGGAGVVALVAVAINGDTAPTAPRATDEPAAIAARPEAPVPAAIPAALSKAAEEAGSGAAMDAADYPGFDVVRIAPDGEALIAGMAVAQSKVLLLLDGEEHDSVDTDAEGRFVSFLTLPPSDQPRVLSLRMVTAQGSTDSEDRVIIAPRSVQAAPEPKPDTGAEAAAADQVAALATQTPATQQQTPAPQAETPGQTPEPALVDTIQEPVSRTDLADDTAPETGEQDQAVSARQPPDRVRAATPDAVPAPQPAPEGPEKSAAADSVTPPADAPQADATASPDTTDGEDAQALAGEGGTTETSASGAASSTAQAETVQAETVQVEAVQAETEQVETEQAETVQAGIEPEAPPQLTAAAVSATATAVAQTAATDALSPAAQPDQAGTTPIPAQPPAGDAATAPRIDSSPAPAPLAPTVLLANRQGVRVLQSGKTVQDTDQVALDAITYSDEGEVALSGRGSGQGFVRVYLDNTPITTSRISEDGNWRAELPNVDTGVYTLRVDEVGADGAVTSRVESPFKREAPEALADAIGEAGQPLKALTVQPGDTLWAIATNRYGDGFQYVQVFRANADRIRNPDLIYPGQVFALPEPEPGPTPETPPGE